MDKWFRLQKHSLICRHFGTLALELEKISSMRLPRKSPPAEGKVLIPTVTSSLLNDAYSVMYSFHFETGIIFISTNSLHCIWGILSAPSTGNICLETACEKLRYVFLTWAWVHVGSAYVFFSLVVDCNYILGRILIFLFYCIVFYLFYFIV